MEVQMKSLILLATAVLSLALLALVNGSCPDNFYQSVENLCCKLCPKGTFLSKPCNEDEGNSVCETCPRSTYMSEANNSTECLHCTKCASSKIVLEECEPTKNRKCGCPHGKFHDPHYLYCMDCSKCPVGEGVMSPCTQTRNTKCQPCPKGTFSDLESFEKKCVSCTKCEPAGITVVKEECNASRDTICERTNLTLHLITSSHSLASSALHQVPSSGYSQPVEVKKSPAFQLIVPIISVSVLICAFAVALIYYFTRRRRSDDTNDTSHPLDEREVSEYNFPVPATSSTLAQLRSSSGLRGRRSYHGRPREPESQSDGNGKNTMLVRDLPGNVFIELGRLLNPKSFNNWIQLAGLLGFTNTHVRNWELEPEEATQCMLNEWSQRDSSTVDVLIGILKEMKRDDCVQILKQWDS